LCQALFSKLALNPESLNFLISDFELPINQSEFNGELNLGYLLENINISFNIPINKLPMHTFVAGMSGFGKSNFVKILAEQLIQRNHDSFHIYDPKADEYIELAQKYPDILILNYKDLRFNPLTPPPNMPRINWFQVFINHFSQCFNFWQGSEGLLLEHLMRVAEQNQTPDLSLLFQSVLSSKSKFGYKDMMIKSTVVSRLQMLLQLFQDTFTINSEMLKIISNKRIIFLTNGLMSEAESWLTEILLLWEFYYRVYNPDQRQFTLKLYDECQHRLFSSEKEKNIQKISSAIISQLVDQARALNIGICSLSQEPSTLIKSVINNSWLKIAFHLNSGGEIKIMKEAMGLNEEQTDHLFYLEPGEAIVRTAGGFMDAVLVKLYEFENSETINNKDFWEYQNEQKHRLYEESEIENAVKIKSTLMPKPLKVINIQKQKPLEINKSISLNKAAKAAQSIIRIWLNLSNPFLIQSQIFGKAGINSGSLQAQIKKYLLREGFIKEHSIQYNKTYVVVWEPVEKAYELAGIDKPQYESKGGYLHKFIAHHIKSWAISKGYSVDIEYLLSNNKAVDLVLNNNNELIFIEIGITSLVKEIGNILKDFNTSLIPDKLFLVAKDNKDRTALKIMINEDTRLIGILNKLEIKLAGEFLVI